MLPKARAALMHTTVNSSSSIVGTLASIIPIIVVVNFAATILIAKLINLLSIIFFVFRQMRDSQIIIAFDFNHLKIILEIHLSFHL